MLRCASSNTLTVVLVCPHHDHQHTAPRLGDGDILVPDTNVLLHNLDLLEHSAIDNIVLLSTVLEEAK